MKNATWSGAAFSSIDNQRLSDYKPVPVDLFAGQFN